MELKLLCRFLFMLQFLSIAHAWPALPNLVSNGHSLTTIQLNNETILSRWIYLQRQNTSHSDASASSSEYQTSSLSTIGIVFPVPNTPITLRFVLYTNPIEPTDMQRTILQTQLKLRRYITTHYKAATDVLFHSDDPYMSDSEYTGCFFAITHWPPNRQKRLTYGMVDAVLKGVWEFLYRGGRFMKSDFYVDHETLESVGYGRVDREGPGANGEVA